METLPALWIVAAALFAAGFVKGTAGVGLPLTAIGILTFFTDPRTAFAISLLPILLSNVIQLWRVGGVMQAIPRYLPFLVTLVVVIPISLKLTADASERLLLGVIGGVIMAFIALNVTKWAPYIPERHDRAAQIAAGIASGILGGMVGIWLPPMLIYITARRVQKDEFVRATGLLLFAGTVPLFFGYIHEGFLDGPLLWLSAALLVPNTIGLLIGERLRSRLSDDTFRKVVFFIFFVMGANMLRRAIMG